MERPADPALAQLIDDFVSRHTRDITLVTDTSGRVTWVSPSLTRILGWRPEDVLGQVSREFVHPDDVAIVLDVYARSDAGEVVTSRVRARRRDGSYAWSDLLTQALVGTDGTRVGRMTTFRDVHTEVASLLDLEESKRLYRLLAENSSDFVTLASPEGILTWASPSSTTVVGWHPEEAYGRPTASFLHPDDIPRLVALREQMSAGHTSTLRARIQRVSGEYHWFDLTIKPVYDDDGALIGRVTAYRDVQDQVETAQALAASEYQFRMLAENSTDVVVHAREGSVVWVSPSLESALGWRPSDWIGARPADFVHPDDVTLALAQQERDSVDPTRVRLRLRAADGAYHWVESHEATFRDEDGQASGWITSFRIIDDLVAAEEELDRRARFDTLTGLLNRHEVFERLAARGRRSGETTALLFCDLDRFKEINDTFGHAAGDEVLRIVADRVSDTIRRDDIAARIGGDELLVLLAGVHDLAGAAAIAEGIRQVASEPIALDAATVSVTLSIGVTLAQPGESADDLVARADQAMYEAKEGGRDRVVSILSPSSRA